MTPTLLLVDDQLPNLILLERMLEPLECRIIRATSGAEALAVVDLQSVDLVLLDVHMPGLDGFEVLSRLRSRSTWLPIVLVTAAERDHERLRGAVAGADEFIEKPVVRELLLSRVRNLLGLKAAREQLAQRNAVLEQLLLRQQELLQLISEDLHGPLLTVQTNLRYARQLLTTADSGEPVAAGALDDAVSASSRIVALAESLIAITLLERGEYPVRRSRIDVKTLIDDVVPTFGRQAAKRSVTLTSEAPSGLMVVADARLIKRALESIVDLAVREAPAGTTVAVDGHLGNEISISISRSRLVPLKDVDGPPGAEALRNATIWPATQFPRRVMQVHDGRLTLDATATAAAEFVLHFPAPGGTVSP